MLLHLKEKQNATAQNKKFVGKKRKKSGVAKLSTFFRAVTPGAIYLFLHHLARLFKILSVLFSTLQPQ